MSPGSRQVYRKLRLPDSDIRILLQKTNDKKTSKERMHLDLEADDVEAEVQRLRYPCWPHTRVSGLTGAVQSHPVR